MLLGKGTFSHNSVGCIILWKCLLTVSFGYKLALKKSKCPWLTINLTVADTRHQTNDAHTT